MINSFTGRYRWLSNFWPCRVTLDGMEFRSVEHAYQAAKATDRKERRWIQEQPTPGAAKRAGRRVRSIDPDWDDKKIAVMIRLLDQKFSDPDLRHKLIETGSRELIEGNTWHDNFWGQCMCADCVLAGQQPKNVLGKLLEQVRRDL